MIYEIHTIRRVVPNREYIYTVNEFIIGKVVRRSVRKLDKKQVDQIISVGGFQKVDIVGDHGSYSVLQKNVEMLELRDISRPMTKEDFKDEAHFIIRGSDKLYKISLVQDRLKVNELHKTGPIYCTHVFDVQNITWHHVTFDFGNGKSETTYQLHALALVDKDMLRYVREWDVR